MPQIKDARVKIVVKNTMNTCLVCGLPRSVCRNKLNFKPRGGGADESKWKRANGLEEHIANTRRKKKV